MHMPDQVVKSLALALWALVLGSTLCQAASLAAVPRATGLLVDQVKLLSDAERRVIQGRLEEVQASGRAQIGILVSAGTDDESTAAYALRVAEAWKLGGKADDAGLLILIVPSKDTARIEVGYGLEGDLPDARAAIFVREYLQRAKADGAGVALNALLDRIVPVLPTKARVPRALASFIERHVEWKMPIVMLVVSVFTLFPLLVSAAFGRVGTISGARAQAWPSAGTAVCALISAGLFALALGFGAKAFWGSSAIGYTASAIAFALPLLWSLNTCDGEHMGLATRAACLAGNLGLFAYIFGALTILAGAAMVEEHVPEVWVAPLFAGLFAAGALVVVIGGRIGALLMKLLSYYMFFLLALAITYLALKGVLKDPTATAVALAGVFAVLMAIGMTLDDRAQPAPADKHDGKGKGKGKGNWAWMFTAAAVLFMLPFMVVALVHAWFGEAFATHFSAVMAGDGSFSQFVWWASGALGGSALLVGLGGKFGGGGAGD